MASMTRNLQAQITTVVVGDDDTRAEGTSADRPPTSRILCVRTIKQTRTNELGVPELLKVLPDDEHWVGCLVPANQLEPDGSCEHLPLHVVGNTPDGKSYVVAVASSRVQILRDLLFSFSLAPQFGPDGSEPIKAEVAVYGIAQARQKSQSRYVEKAIRGVLSSQHQGLGRYYQRNTRNQRLRLPIDCAILTRDVEGASPKVRSHFHNLCCFLALHLLNDINGETSRELINRNEETWMEKIKRSMMAWPTEDATMGFHKVSLIRALLECAGGREDALQRCFDKARSANDNLAILGDIFGVELTEPVSFGRCRTSRAGQDPPGASDSDVQQDLSEASYKTKDPLGYTASKCGQRSVTDLQDRVARYLPVWFFNAVYEALPADLINALSYEAITGAQTMRFHTSCKIPLLGNPESSLPLLIFYCANMRVDNTPLRKWMASGKGEKGYRQIIATLRESQAADQIALCLVALISYDLVLGSADENPGPTHGSYLGDFLQHLNGCELKNRRGMWEQMICSFTSVRTCHEIAGIWLDTVCQAQSSHGLNKLSEWYWEHRSEGTHEFALEKVCDYLGKERNSLRRWGGSAGEDGEDLGEEMGEEYVIVARARDLL